MWVVTLLLLAVAAYFLLNALRSKKEHDSQNQQNSAGDADNSESAQLADNAGSSITGTDASSGSAGTHANGASAGTHANGASADAVQNAGGSPNGAATGGAAASGAAVAGATGVSAAAAIASAREHNLKDLSGDAASDVREMLKILNLRDSDSARLSIDKAQFAGLLSGNSSLGGDELSAVADKLRWMLR